MVDDPYVYGAAAAANSLSDIYAMGADPALAMNILCAPKDMDGEALNLIMKGGFDKIREAGAVIGGGHSIKDREPKFGFCVTGFARPDKILANSTAKPGDILILTKAIGTGILSRALRKGRLSEETGDALYSSMMKLNKDAAETLRGFSVSSCTDVSGFGLLGHVYEMAKGSGLTFTVESSKVPLFPETLKMAKEGFLPAGIDLNRRWVAHGLYVSASVKEETVKVLFDPQTSGGLMFTVSPSEAPCCISEMHKHGVPAVAIGCCSDFNENQLKVV